MRSDGLSSLGLVLLAFLALLFLPALPALPALLVELLFDGLRAQLGQTIQKVVEHLAVAAQRILCDRPFDLGAADLALGPGGEA